MTIPLGERPLLVFRHVAWEVPHRILDWFGDIPTAECEPLTAGCRLPPPESVCGVLIMGGPIGVGDAPRMPGLAAELRWLERALAAAVPMLGICLGAQLIASALGARVDAGDDWELGWLPIEVFDERDPVLGGLAPRAEVLHWHRDRCELPAGGTLLASSPATPCQAFRLGSAWGIQFHPEVDAELLARWLRVPVMAEQSVAALGPGGARELLERADGLETALHRGVGPGFAEFAMLCHTRRAEMAGAQAPFARASLPLRVR